MALELIAWEGQIELEEDDWLEDEPDEDDENEWVCRFPGECLMPGIDHHSSECFTREMAERWRP